MQTWYQGDRLCDKLHADATFMVRYEILKERFKWVFTSELVIDFLIFRHVVPRLQKLYGIAIFQESHLIFANLFLINKSAIVGEIFDLK